jgi:hypothetical protein
VTSPLEASSQNPRLHSKPKYLINELHKEKYGWKDLKHQALTERASLGRSSPMYPGKYSFPFYFSFSFF